MARINAPPTKKRLPLLFAKHSRNRRLRLFAVCASPKNVSGSASFSLTNAYTFSPVNTCTCKLSQSVLASSVMLLQSKARFLDVFKREKDATSSAVTGEKRKCKK